MYLCGYNGFIHFNPDKIEVDTIMPKIYVSGIEIHGKTVGVRDSVFGHVILDKSILITKKIDLSHEQNNFAIHLFHCIIKCPTKTNMLIG